MKITNNKIYLAALAVFLMVIAGYTLQNYLGAKAPESPHGNKAAITERAENIAVKESDAASPEGAGRETALQSEEKFAATPAAGLSNNKRGWGLKRNSENKQPEMPPGISATLRKYDAYWIGASNDKAVYLTFDEGYENGFTPKILDVLKANDVKAAFFVTGHYLKTQPDLVRRMAEEGHIVANHTDTHPSLPDVSDEQIKKELQVVEERYAEITGRKDMKYLRPPKGEYSERTLAVTRELGYHNIFWSIALVDWVPMPGGPQEAYQSVLDNLHNGAVILLHAVSGDNAGAMDRILKDTKARGYTFKTLDELAQGQ